MRTRSAARHGSAVDSALGGLLSDILATLAVIGRAGAVTGRCEWPRGGERIAVALADSCRESVSFDGCADDSDASSAGHPVTATWLLHPVLER